MRPGSRAGALRRVGIAAALAAALALLPLASGAGAADEPPVELSIPSLSGPYQVGTRALLMVDRSRRSGFGVSGPRRLMVQVSYPRAKRSGARCKKARYLPKAIYRRLQAVINEDRDAVIDSRMCAGGPIARGERPVLVFSHAYTADRFVYTSLTADLASRGYIVVSPDHTSDAFAVRFPGGHVVDGAFGTPLASKGLTLREAVRLETVRTRDVRFVLSRVERMARRSRSFLGGHVDRRRVGILGHSLGGATATRAATRDSRFKAAVDMDGSLFGGWATRVRLKTPYMLLTSEGGLGSIPYREQSICSFYGHLRGPRQAFVQIGSQHLSYSDFMTLAPQIAKADPDWPYAGLYKIIVGSLDPDRAITAQRRMLARFFRAHLKRVAGGRAVSRDGKRRHRVRPPAGFERIDGLGRGCLSPDQG